MTNPSTLMEVVEAVELSEAIQAREAQESPTEPQESDPAQKATSDQQTSQPHRGIKMSLCPLIQTLLRHELGWRAALCTSKCPPGHQRGRCESMASE